MSAVSSFVSYIWEYSKLHPGVVLVLIGVAGEGVELGKYIWKERSEKFDLTLEVIGLFFWSVVVIGLIKEMSDSAHSDNEILALEDQAEPRFFKKQPEAIQRLSQYAGTRAVVFSTPGDPESDEIASEICAVLTAAHWSVQPVLFTVLNPGINTGISPNWPTNFGVPGAREMQEANKILVDELNLSDVVATPFAVIPPKVTFRGMVVQVGRKPSPDEAEQFAIMNKMIDENSPTTGHEWDNLFNRLMEINRKKYGSSGGSFTEGGFIPSEAYPPF